MSTSRISLLAPHRRAILCFLAALLCFAPSAALANALTGVWRIEIVDGPSKGDHGQIRLTPTGPGVYSGEMRFTDSRTDITADEQCVIRMQHDAVEVRCQTDEPGWLPDDFDLTRTGPDELRGPHISAVSGEAVFRRLRDPELLS